MGEQKKSQKMRKRILNKEREPCDERDCKKKTHRNRNKTQMLSRTITISIIKYEKKSRTKKCNTWKIKSNNKLKMWRKKRKKTGVKHVKAQVQPYPVESVEIVEWLLCVECVDILLVVDWGDLISTPTYTGILERLRHHHRNHHVICVLHIVWIYTTMGFLFVWKWDRRNHKE